MGLNLVSGSFMSTPSPLPNPLPRHLPAIFLDSALVFIDDRPEGGDPMTLRLRPGAAIALRGLGRLDCCLVLVGAPDAVAPGPQQVTVLRRLKLRMRALFGDCGVVLAGCYHCLHDGDAAGRRACLCRRPMPGLLQRASTELRLRMTASWMITGLLDGIESGRRAGCRTILLGGAGETEWRQGPRRTPHYFVGSLASAARVIADVRRDATCPPEADPR